MASSYTLKVDLITQLKYIKSERLKSFESWLFEFILYFSAWKTRKMSFAVNIGSKRAIQAEVDNGDIH